VAATVLEELEVPFLRNRHRLLFAHAHGSQAWLNEGVVGDGAGHGNSFRTESPCGKGLTQRVVQRVGRAATDDVKEIREVRDLQHEVTPRRERSSRQNSAVRKPRAYDIPLMPIFSPSVGNRSVSGLVLSYGKTPRGQAGPSGSDRDLANRVEI
jgi:hypothetical protein